MEFETNQIFETIAQRLPEAGIEAVMIGGHAVNHYGYTRATQDIDFMIAASDEEKVTTLMRDAGFTNIATLENVIFIQKPDSTIRIDFLKVNQETMNLIMEHAVDIEYASGYPVKVPQLRDLLAMKIFSLASGGVKREAKDLYDIVNLVIENGFDSDKDLRKLCDKFGTNELYNRLMSELEKSS